MVKEILIKHKRCSARKLHEDYPSYQVLDLSSKAEEPWVRFSPFYPHGGIPVPTHEGLHSQSVEGLWQGLKVFADHSIDTEKFRIVTMRGLKRTVRRFGPCHGHQTGSGELLGYLDARFEVYLPAYLWVLENRLSSELAELRQRHQQSGLIFLDYETNIEPESLQRPLSHAGLVRAYLLNQWPRRGRPPAPEPADYELSSRDY